MTKKIFQIQIALEGSKPKIWRRVLIPSDLLLSDFHTIIQITMGWSNSHLHQFIKDDTFYTMKMNENSLWEDMDTVDYKKMKVSDLLKNEKEEIVYEYDFGDSWEHAITLEKILPVDDSVKYPICLTGKMKAPPEDCGGIWGYADMLEALEDPEHEEYEEYVEWLGDDFDPQYFDKNEINKLLRKSRL